MPSVPVADGMQVDTCCPGSRQPAHDDAQDVRPLYQLTLMHKMYGNASCRSLALSDVAGTESHTA